MECTTLLLVALSFVTRGAILHSNVLYNRTYIFTKHTCASSSFPPGKSSDGGEESGRESTCTDVFWESRHATGQHQESLA